jgi:hypothetical protein
MLPGATRSRQVSLWPGHRTPPLDPIQLPRRPAPGPRTRERQPRRTSDGYHPRHCEQHEHHRGICHDTVSFQPPERECRARREGRRMRGSVRCGREMPAVVLATPRAPPACVERRDPRRLAPRGGTGRPGAWRLSMEGDRLRRLTRWVPSIYPAVHRIASENTRRDQEGQLGSNTEDGLADLPAWSSVTPINQSPRNRALRAMPAWCRWTSRGGVAARRPGALRP